MAANASLPTQEYIDYYVYKFSEAMRFGDVSLMCYYAKRIEVLRDYQRQYEGKP